MLKKITYQDAVLLLIIPSVAMANIHHGANDAFELLVYKSPSCGCCKKWVSHLQDNGFEVESIYENNMRSIKTKYKISQKNTSCHTGIVGSYFIEGHVPASDIRELLAKNPDVAGLTVPGMPAGTNVPGMETINEKAEYDVLYVRKDGSSAVWKHYN